MITIALVAVFQLLGNNVSGAITVIASRHLGRERYGCASHSRGGRVPLVTVKVFERRLDPQAEERIIKAMTDALLEALEAEELRDHTWVLVEGYDPHRWGRGGKPWEEA